MLHLDFFRKGGEQLVVFWLCVCVSVGAGGREEWSSLGRSVGDGHAKSLLSLPKKTLFLFKKERKKEML